MAWSKFVDSDITCCHDNTNSTYCLSTILVAEKHQTELKKHELRLLDERIANSVFAQQERDVAALKALFAQNKKTLDYQKGGGCSVKEDYAKREREYQGLTNKRYIIKKSKEKITSVTKELDTK